MREIGPQNPYESYCYSCNVSAPIDTRFCGHCGGRLSKERGIPTTTMAMPFVGQAADENEDEISRRVGSASPMTAVWILLFVVGTVYRVCA